MKTIKATELKEGMELVERDGGLLVIDLVTRCRKHVEIVCHSMMRNGIVAKFTNESLVRIA